METIDNQKVFFFEFVVLFSERKERIRLNGEVRILGFLLTLTLDTMIEVLTKLPFRGSCYQLNF